MNNVKKKPNSFLRKIQNRRFRELFFRNWLWVFLSIVCPLVICACSIQYFSEQSLIKEVNATVERSTQNTKATIQVLLNEACNTLDREISDGKVTDFFEARPQPRPEYDYILKIRACRDRLTLDRRENLYDSVDAYSRVSDFLVSTKYSGQSYRWVADQTLVESFDTARQQYPNQTVFAGAREVDEKTIITVYRTSKTAGNQDSFVAISLDTEKLAQYIVNDYDSTEGFYLIVDSANRVVMDTAGRMDGETLELSFDGMESSTVTTKLLGEPVCVSWANLDLFEWKFVQIVPMEELERSSIRLQQTMFLIVLLGVIIGVVLSYGATSKLFRPVEAILTALENPQQHKVMGEGSDEVQFLLSQILELFQKNITLENEKLGRAFALRNARAKALQEQMTPHFINNVLQAINWMAMDEIGEDSQTSRAILLLADLIRTGKEQTGNLTTVAGEVEYTRRFIELECLRYGSEIRCRFTVDPAAEEMPIPCISLQTMVENSVRHGIIPKGGEGTVYVLISRTEEGGLHVRVEDDGVGMDPAVVERLTAQMQEEYLYTGEHVGLINLFQRFRLIYGDNCRFSMSDSDRGGACVDIKTPEIREEDMRVWYEEDPFAESGDGVET